MAVSIPDGSVVITPAQMYEQIQNVAKGFADLTGEVRAVRSEIAPAFAGIRADVQDHEKTIRSLVRDVTVMRTQLRAAWAGICLLVAALGTITGVVLH